jgi:hypothetical protein
MLIKETDQSARWLNPLLLMARLRHGLGANEGRFKSRSGHQRAGRAMPVYEFTH